MRVLWAGLVSDYFTVGNGFKQGGVISRILICIYIDGWLKKLSLFGVGCYIGTDFAGFLAYANDIRYCFKSLTSNATRKLLAICDDFAAQYDIVFHTVKSKILVVISHNRRFMSNDMGTCNLYINGKVIENVNHYSHLRHIINSDFTDDDNNIQRLNFSVSKVNNLLCFFNKPHNSIG
jgi:hypothetical protein